MNLYAHLCGSERVRLLAFIYSIPSQTKIKNTGRIASSVYTMVSLFTAFAQYTT